MDKEGLQELRQVRDELANIGEAAITTRGERANDTDAVCALCDLMARLASQVRMVASNVDQLARRSKQLASNEDPKPI